MKQLKFMLAAATAISLATAAQADTVTPLVNNDTFDGEYTVTEKVDGVDTPVTKTFVKGLAITDVPGYEYLGSDDDGENDSVVDEVGYPNSGNALKVNTGTTPVARQINKGSELNLTAVKSVYIDTMVQFTVTPYSDKDNVNPTIGQDKLMIYLQEGEADADGNKPLSLMAIAGFAGAEGSFEAKPYKLVGMDNVQPNKWYHLVVESYADISTQDPAGEDFAGYFPGFRVFLTDPLAEPSEPAALTYEGDLGEFALEERFPGEGLLSLALVGGGNEVGLAANDVTLTYVGFAGEGVVDNLSVSTITDATSLDFTLDLGEGVSAVSWTVNGDAQDTEGGKFTAASDVTTLTVAIQSVTYEAGYAGTQDWTAWTYNDTKSGSVEIKATKFADVSEGGVVTPTDETVKAVTTGSFTVPEATEGNAEAVAEAKADLAKALTWASSKAGKSYTAAIAAINGMTFDEDGDPSGTGDAKTNAEAYLLDCAANQTAIDKAMEDFVLTGFSIGADGAMTFGVGEAAKGNGTAYANGKIEVRGKAALNAANWVKDCPGATFFKAFLVK